MDYLLNDTIEFLEKIGWHYRREENTNLLALSLCGEKETYPMLIYAKAPFWICIAQLPWEIPDRNRLEVAEYLHRANYGLLLGSFEMDYDNGDVRFRSAMVRENPADGRIHPRSLHKNARRDAGSVCGRHSGYCSRWRNCTPCFGIQRGSPERRLSFLFIRIVSGCFLLFGTPLEIVAN